MSALQRLQAETKLAERKELPKAVDGVSVSWKEKGSSTGGTDPGSDPDLSGTGVYREGSGAEKTGAGAGMGVAAGLRADGQQAGIADGRGKRGADGLGDHGAGYERKREAGGGRRYVYEEMTLACRELQNGVSEGRAYENFGLRCRLPCYLKLSALLEQNLKKGNKGLTQMLQAEVTGAFEQRKELAREQGEKASTRLLFPMVLMLAVVMLLVLIPAGMSMQV